MNCTTTTTGNCTPNCVHPFRYLFELAYQGVKGPNPKYTFAEALERLLDKGIVFNNCNLCCPNCEVVYSLSSAETMLKLFEALGMLPPPFINQPPQSLPAANYYQGEPCCSNIYASVETYNIYADALVPSTNDEVVACCNGFNECIDELICWVTQDVYKPLDKITRILDKGVVEYSGIGNGCGDTSSQLCYFLDLLKEYLSKLGEDLPTHNRGTVIDRIFDRGITISCNRDSNEIVIGSTETWLKYAEAVGLLPSVFQTENIGETTTTTTTISQ